jgi:hypothetical protein
MRLFHAAAILLLPLFGMCRAHSDPEHHQLSSVTKSAQTATEYDSVELLKQLSSVTKGAQTMNKTVVLSSWGNGAPALALDVQEDFKLVHERGADFDMFFIVPVDSQARSTGAVLGVYVGHNPNPFAKGNQSSHEQMQPGGRIFDWEVWKTEASSGTVFHKECIIQDLFRNVPGLHAGAGVPDLKVHMFIKATEPELVNRFQEAAHSLRLSLEK